MADRKLIKDGIVLTLDRGIGDFDRADVLVEDGKIAAVGPDLEAPEGAEVIDASRAIVMPGFVDTHRHTWQAQLRTIACDWTLGQYMTGLHSGLSGHFRPEDTYIGNLLGTVEALDSGITTLLDWSHNLATPEHADAAVEGLKESGARAVFAHGGGAPQWDVVPNAVPHPDDARRVRAEHFPTDDGLVTMAMALRGPEIATKEVTVTDYELARDLGLRITVHVGNGEMAKDRPLAWLHSEGLMGDDVTYVHCNAVGDDELAMIADDRRHRVLLARHRAADGPRLARHRAPAEGGDPADDLDRRLLLQRRPHVRRDALADRDAARLRPRRSAANAASRSTTCR